MTQTQGTQAVTAGATIWKLDPAHSHAQFTVRHMMISNVKGEFTRVEGQVVFDKSNPQNLSAEATIDVSTINTREPDRDNHLKSPDFFDVAKYPRITFKSNRALAGKNGPELIGDLTIHGVTREITLEVDGPTPPMKDPWGNIRIGASATAKINRKDFGLAWNQALEAGGVLVGDEVRITIDVELLPQTAGADSES